MSIIRKRIKWKEEKKTKKKILTGSPFGPSNPIGPLKINRNFIRREFDSFSNELTWNEAFGLFKYWQ